MLDVGQFQGQCPPLACRIDVPTWIMMPRTPHTQTTGTRHSCWLLNSTFIATYLQLLLGCAVLMLLAAIHGSVIIQHVMSTWSKFRTTELHHRLHS